MKSTNNYLLTALCFAPPITKHRGLLKNNSYTAVARALHIKIPYNHGEPIEHAWACQRTQQACVWLSKSWSETQDMVFYG